MGFLEIDKKLLNITLPSYFNRIGLIKDNPEKSQKHSRK